MTNENYIELLQNYAKIAKAVENLQHTAMKNLDHVEILVQEIASLKRRVAYLESLNGCEQ